MVITAKESHERTLRRHWKSGFHGWGDSIANILNDTAFRPFCHTIDHCIRYSRTNLLAGVI